MNPIEENKKYYQLYKLWGLSVASLLLLCLGISIFSPEVYFQTLRVLYVSATSLIWIAIYAKAEHSIISWAGFPSSSMLHDARIAKIIAIIIWFMTVIYWKYRIGDSSHNRIIFGISIMFVVIDVFKYLRKAREKAI